MNLQYTLSLMSITMLLFCATTVTAQFESVEHDDSLRLLDVKKIWDQGPHNAFTDLIRYHDKWVCAFREAPEHKGGVPDSIIRVLVSDDAVEWRSVAELSDPRGDIRDAKLSTTPDGRLMLLTAIQLFDIDDHRHQSLAYFTEDLETWTDAQDVGEPGYWLWGITWHDGVGYSIGYRVFDAQNMVGRLYTTRDGRDFDVLVETLDTGTANESAIAFDGDTAYCLLRRIGPGAVGRAEPPYTDWTWRPLELPIGGPELILLPDGRLLGGARLYLPNKRRPTALFRVDPNTGGMDRVIDLPSGGDTSYPGMVWHDGVLHVSYYSSHEGKSSIYVARLTP